MNFGERLSILRKQKNLSQEALAEQLGVSRQAVSKWERNETQPELSKITALCELFEVTPNELLGYEKSREEPKTKGKKSNQRAIFWLVIGCMGFVVTAFCLGWAIANPHIYNGIGGIHGSLLGNDCFELFLVGSFVMVTSILESYFVISGKGSFFEWLKKGITWLMKQLFKLDEK